MHNSDFQTIKRIKLSTTCLLYCSHGICTCSLFQSAIFVAPVLKSSTLNKKFLGMWSYDAVRSMYTAINESLFLSITVFSKNIASAVYRFLLIP